MFLSIGIILITLSVIDCHKTINLGLVFVVVPKQI